MLPGVDTPDERPRDSSMFGLPEQAINITIDGINTQNNFQRDTDGFYSMVFPQLDAVEQVTVTGAAAGSDSAGGGSVAIRFVTRSGTNSFRGTGYYYFRHPNLNTNYYFNEINDLPKNRLILNQFGASVGGPISIPKVVDGRARRSSSSTTRSSTSRRQQPGPGTLLHPRTRAACSATTSLQVASRRCARSTCSSWRPTTARSRARIRPCRRSRRRSARCPTATVAAGTGKITRSRTTSTSSSSSIWRPASTTTTCRPSKVDFNLSPTAPAQRIVLVAGHQPVSRTSRTAVKRRIPGLPNMANYHVDSNRGIGHAYDRRSAANGERAGRRLAVVTWHVQCRRRRVAVRQSGRLQPRPSRSARRRRRGRPIPTPGIRRNWNITDTVNWLKGNHTISFGGSFTPGHPAQRHHARGADDRTRHPVRAGPG